MKLTVNERSKERKLQRVRILKDRTDWSAKELGVRILKDRTHELKLLESEVHPGNQLKIDRNLLESEVHPGKI